MAVFVRQGQDNSWKTAVMLRNFGAGKKIKVSPRADPEMEMRPLVSLTI
ncbi:hypothetical protein [Siminovitchia fordii]|nr:hypothetical protein [Siminovitchia fordii]